MSLPVAISLVQYLGANITYTFGSREGDISGLEHVTSCRLQIFQALCQLISPAATLSSPAGVLIAIWGRTWYSWSRREICNSDHHRSMSTSSSSTQPINIRRSIDEGHGADDSDAPALSQDTLAALNEFLSEAQAAASEQSNPFSENWGLSQVGYLGLFECSRAM